MDADTEIARSTPRHETGLMTLNDVTEILTPRQRIVVVTPGRR